MNKSLSITTMLDEPGLLTNLVEKLASRPNNSSNKRIKVLRNWEALTTSSIESYVNGTVVLSAEENRIDMPFINSFLFTCTRGKDGLYHLAWSTSLS